MTDRLNSGGDVANRIVPPKDKEERVRFWIERGNLVLWGEAPTTKGEYLEPRRDLEWVWRNGSYSIEPRGSRPRA